MIDNHSSFFLLFSFYIFRSTFKNSSTVFLYTMADANSHDTSKVVIVNNGAGVEDGQKFLAPFAEEQTQQKIDKDVSSPPDGNHTSDKGRLSPIQPSRDMNISNKVTTGPEGVTVETVFHGEGASHLFEGTYTSDTRNPDFGLAKVTGNLNSVYNAARI